MEENIRRKAFSGIIWGGLEKLSLQIFGFVQGIILARLLSPADYGLLAMVGIFVMLSYCFVDAGFGTALIQKKDRTEKDYSTVFVMNLTLSFFISLILFLSAPFIADFYKEQILIKIVRTYSFIIFFSSLVAIQDVRLTIFLEFRKKSIINIIITIISGIFAIILAFAGYGVWSLVYPQFVMLFLKCLLYWHFQHWIPKLAFSRKSFSRLYGYGTKILISTIVSSFAGNIYSLVIGKKFSASILGFYSRADGYATLPAQTINGVVGNITYPVLSKFQDDETQLISSLKRMIRISAYVIFPIMIGLAVLAKPFVVVLVTEKWLPCVIYLQVLCFDRLWWPISIINMNLLKARGYFDLFFKLEVIKQVIVMLCLVSTMPFGIMGICVGCVFSTLAGMFINSYYTGKILQFGVLRQMNEILPSILYSLVMGGIVYLSIFFLSDMWLKLLVGICVGMFSYVLLSVATKSQDFNYLFALVREKMGR